MLLRLKVPLGITFGDVDELVQKIAETHGIECKVKDGGREFTSDWWIYEVDVPLDDSTMDEYVADEFHRLFGQAAIVSHSPKPKRATAQAAAYPAAGPITERMGHVNNEAAHAARA